MSTDELFAAFTESQIERYKEEVKAKWGRTDAYKQSIDRTRQWTKEDFERIKEEGQAITLSLAKLMEKGVAHAEVQAHIERHFQHINQFYDCSLRCIVVSAPCIAKIHVLQRITTRLLLILPNLCVMQSRTIAAHMKSNGTSSW